MIKRNKKIDVNKMVMKKSLLALGRSASGPAGIGAYEAAPSTSYGGERKEVVAIWWLS